MNRCSMFFLQTSTLGTPQACTVKLLNVEGILCKTTNSPPNPNQKVLLRGQLYWFSGKTLVFGEPHLHVDDIVK